MEMMRLAFKLAKKADPFPNPRVGAILVKDGQLIGVGYHKGPGKPHAEIEAKRRSKDPHVAQNSILYVTLEPCSHTAKRTPPCVDAIIREKIAKVVFAMKDPNPLVDGAGALRGAGIIVEGPSDQKAAELMNKRYIASMRKKPIVTMKMAMSADGKTATKTGDSGWISCPESRDFVHAMRAESDAVMVGAGTVKSDDPELTSHGKGKDPWRVIIDGKLSTSLHSRVIRNHDKRTIIATTSKAKASRIAILRRMGLQTLICGDDKVDLRMLIQGLSAMGMKRILIEGGNELNAAALDSGIVDRLYLFIAPKLIGGKDAKPVIGGKGIEKMSQAVPLSKPKVRRIGEDLLLEYRIRTQKKI
jgi:diaminohydroxyphosphoribosylaminopyrimidine deaminase/5-amino-6-(5-phosphoribosylamino)uracil reductase